MKYPVIGTALIGLSFLACASDADTDTDAEAMEDQTADMASVAVADFEDLANAYMAAYNAQDAAAVGQFYTEDAVSLSANGGIAEGRAAIEEAVTASYAGSPTIQIDVVEERTFGDVHVAMGSYGVQTTGPDGAAISVDGHWMGVGTMTDEGLKMSWLLSNYDGPMPEGMPRGTTPEEAPANEGTLGQLVTDWQQHFNMGHPNVVAQYYAEDAIAAFSGAPPARGRAAIEAILAERVEGSPQLTIHDVGTMELGDGWLVDGGWYELQVDDTESSGTYMLLGERADDGSVTIHWHISNGGPANMTGMTDEEM